jgi:hypothetical protein
VYSAEAHSHTIWLAEGTGAVDPMDRNFGELVRDDVDRWIFAKDGRFVLVEMSADVLLLDVVHGTASSLPALEGGIEYGFDATDTVLAATWTAPPDTMCEGKAAGCKLEAGRWSCGTPVATCGADWDPGCDCAAWSGRPAWNDVRRGSKINRCGEELGEDASPEVIASFPTPVGYDWRVVGGAAPWAYRRGRGDCGEYVVAPVLMYDGTTWFDAFPDVPTDQNVELDVEGPWMLRYVSNGNPVYDLGSTDPLKTVITLDQGVLWPESVPVPPYQPVAEPVETEPTRTTSERPRPHPRDRPRPRPAHPRREH